MTALSTMVTKARRPLGRTQHPAGTLLEEHVAQAEGGRLLVLLGPARLVVGGDRGGRSAPAARARSRARGALSRRVKSTAAAITAANDGDEGDSDRRDLHHLRAAG